MGCNQIIKNFINKLNEYSFIMIYEKKGQKYYEKGNSNFNIPSHHWNVV